MQEELQYAVLHEFVAPAKRNLKQYVTGIKK